VVGSEEETTKEKVIGNLGWWGPWKGKKKRGSSVENEPDKAKKRAMGIGI